MKKMFGKSVGLRIDARHFVKIARPMHDVSILEFVNNSNKHTLQCSETRKRLVDGAMIFMHNFIYWMVHSHVYGWPVRNSKKKNKKKTE